MAFIVMLVIFIPLIAVPEIEKNPLGHPTFYEEQTVPIKDYNIVTELKSLESKGIPNAVFQPDITELNEMGGSVNSNSNQFGTIKDISSSPAGQEQDNSRFFNFEIDMDKEDLKEYLKLKLERFKEAGLNPEYFIIPDVRYQFRLASILNEITEELEMPEIELVVKNNLDELSTELLVLYDQRARMGTEGMETAYLEDARANLFASYVYEYLALHDNFKSSILTIDVQDWSDITAWCLQSFLKITRLSSIDVVVRIENISKVTSPEAISEIISVCSSTSTSGYDTGYLNDGDNNAITRGGEENIVPSENSNSGNGNVKEIILGAMPEYLDLVSVKDEKFTLVIDIINGYYYVILITCLIPNIYFVAWAGFIRRDNRKQKEYLKKHGRPIQMTDKAMESRHRFYDKLLRLEDELGSVILTNASTTGNGQFNNQHRKSLNKSSKGTNLAYQPGKKNGNALPDVTVILPCFNEQKGIALAVERCYNQTYAGRIEILVVDDGSNDNTLKIAKIFEAPFPNRTVRVHHKPNGGKADALNFGIERATGQIILTTDGDSHMDPDAVESLVRGFQENPHAGIVGGFVVIRNEKDSTLVKLQQIEYIFTQDVFRLPQSESASVLIIPGPVFSMGGRVAKTHKASTRTCVEDADLTDCILKDNWGTVAVTDATAHTQAPTSWKAWFKQRKRWVYGQFQVWRENKSFLRRNFWGLYSYFTWLSALLITGMLITTTVALVFIGEWNFFSLLITAQTTVIFMLYFITRGISLARYSYGKHLIKYLPLQVGYDLINGVLCAWLFVNYLTGRGVKIKFGPEVVRVK
jgi:cellulose synthase/poly-beta-1,6-N-acetylglucosamine synthase-like glycosyltransferase